MRNTELFKSTYHNSVRAVSLLEECSKKNLMTRVEANEIEFFIRQANAAANGMKELANGNKPPQIGD